MLPVRWAGAWTPTSTPGLKSVTCSRFVVFRDDNAELAVDQPVEDDDDYDEGPDWGEDDEAPSWLAAAGMSREDWEKEQDAEYKERQQNREEQRLQREAAEMTQEWRQAVADKPADPPRRRR